jgi:EF hand
MSFCHHIDNPFLRKSIVGAAQAAIGVVLLTGCMMTGAPGVAGVSIDVESASQKILDEFDKDHDGKLSRGELAALPSIGAHRDWYDADHDGQISAAELAGGLKIIFDPRVALLSVWCEVTRNGRPLPQAHVEFVPLAALSDAVPAASAVTDEQGVAKLAVAPKDLPSNAPTNLPMIRPGLYLVKVTHPSISIPAEYNSNSTLGKEVSNHSTAGGPLKINLTF